MQNSQTPNEQRERLNTQSSGDQKTSYPLLEREPVDGTPFYIVGNPEIGYKLTWGKFTFTDEPLKTGEEVINWYEDNMWTIILHLIAIGSQFTEDKMRERYPKKEQ